MSETELRAEVERLTNLNHRLSGQIIGMSDRLQASAREIAAKAWDDGFTACGGEHTRQRKDPSHPITRINPHRQPLDLLAGAE